MQSDHQPAATEGDLCSAVLAAAIVAAAIVAAVHVVQVQDVVGVLNGTLCKIQKLSQFALES
jgi:hypothetical protein